jgi:hypothetical protein
VRPKNYVLISCYHSVLSLTVMGGGVEHNIPHSYVMLIKHHTVGNDFVIKGSDVEFDRPRACFSLENIDLSSRHGTRVCGIGP